MATKSLGPAASGTTDITTKADVTSAINSAAGTGLSGSGGTLSVGANYRSIAIPFFLSSTVTTGVKLPKFVAPVAMTIVDMYAVLNAGTGTTTIRPSKNGGTSDGSTLNVTTSTGHTTQSLSLSAGDTLTVNVTAVGTTPSDMSVTFWANVT